MPGEPLDDGIVAPFLFGKMPAHGDFISRGLDDETIETGDAVVAEGLALAMAHWDMRWDDVYVETPVWRFLATPGVLGRNWLAGIFMASVDAVGRQFPLMLGFASPTLALMASSEATEAALDDAENIARSALLESLSVDAAMQRLAAATVTLAPAATSARAVPDFASRLLRGLEAAPWTAEALFWIAGGSADDRIAVHGPLGGESLMALFRRAPANQGVAAEEPASDSADMTGEPVPAPESTPEPALLPAEAKPEPAAESPEDKPAENVVSSADPSGERSSGD